MLIVYVYDVICSELFDIAFRIVLMFMCMIVCDSYARC